MPSVCSRSACVVAILVLSSLPTSIASTSASDKAPAARRLLVKVRAGSPAASLDDALGRAGALGARKGWRSRATRWQVVTLSPEDDWESIAARLAEDPQVEAVEPEKFAAAQTTVPDDLQQEQWALDNTGQIVDGVDCIPGADIDAPEAWDLTSGEMSVSVAVLDTGVRTDHVDLGSNLVAGFDFVNDDIVPSDDAGPGHGTPVAGIIGAVGNNGTGITGINWNVSLLPVKVCDQNGSCPYSAIAAGIEYAMSRGARVINLSVACDEHRDPYTGACGAELPGACWSQMLYDSLDAARMAGVMAVVSAGNCGADLDDDTKAYPCAYELDNVLCVGATDERDELASFSNYGPSHVRVAAPGSKVLSLSTDPTSTILWAGTSFSAPMAAGVAALQLSRNNTLTPSALGTRLSLVEPMASLSGLVAGAARLNAMSSVQDLLLTPRPVSRAVPGTMDGSRSLTGDFDGDGLLDAIEARQPRGIRVALSDGSALGAFTEWSRFGPGAATLVGDFNGDGRDDLARPGEEGIQVMLSTGAAFGAPRRWTHAGWRASIYVADVNGDGRDDIVRQVDRKRIMVSISLGNGFAPPSRWIQDSGIVAKSAMVFGDVNADGRADLVQAARGKIEVGLSNGVSFASPVAWGPAPAESALRAADMDGDGDDDLVLQSGAAGCFDIMLSNRGSFALARPWGCGGPGLAWGPGDFNGDGRADLLKRGTSGWDSMLSSH